MDLNAVYSVSRVISHSIVNYLILQPVIESKEDMFEEAGSL